MMTVLFGQLKELISASIAAPTGLGLGGALSGFNNQVVNTGGAIVIDRIIYAILYLVFSIIGLVLLGMIIYAGFTWLTSGGDQNSIERSRKTITTGVIGIVIVALAFFIANFLVTFFKLPVGFSFTTLFNSL